MFTILNLITNLQNWIQQKSQHLGTEYSYNIFVLVLLNKY